MSSQTSSTNSSQQTSPWGPQASALTTAFGNAQNAYNTASQAQAPTNFTAQMTPDQLSTYNNMLGYANGNTSPATETAAGNGMLSSGTAATNSAINGMTSYNPSATNNTQSVVNAATQYANGQNIQGQVNNSMLMANQEANQVTLPGMEQSAANNGNINGSRTGLSEGIVQQGLSEQAANLGSSLYNSSYNTGLQLAENQQATNNQQSLTNNQALGTLGSGYAGQGVSTLSSGINDQNNLYTMAQAGGAGQQTNNQEGLTNQQQQFQAQSTDPYSALDGLMGIIGGTNWGSNSTGTSNTTTTPSALSTIGGIMSSLGGFAMMSDRRTKADIAQIGELYDGTPVYRFRYKGEHKVQIGLMAQDVEGVTPEAVHTIGGIKFVNYDAATRHLV